MANLRRLELLLLLLCITAPSRTAAQGFLTDISFSLGDGKLYKPYTDAFRLSGNFGGHINYLRAPFFVDLGFCGLLFGDKDASNSYTGIHSKRSVLMFEVPVGLGTYIKLGGGNIFMIGSEVALLFDAGGSGAYFTAGSHVDFLFHNRHERPGGIFLKGLTSINAGTPFAPRYIGIGYKRILTSEREGRIR